MFPNTANRSILSIGESGSIPSPSGLIMLDGSMYQGDWDGVYSGGQYDSGGLLFPMDSGSSDMAFMNTSFFVSAGDTVYANVEIDGVDHHISVFIDQPGHDTVSVWGSMEQSGFIAALTVNDSPYSGYNYGFYETVETGTWNNLDILFKQVWVN